MTNKGMEKCSILLTIREMQIGTKTRYRPQTCKNGYNQKEQQMLARVCRKGKGHIPLVQM